MKYPELDVLYLLTKYDREDWNIFLSDCYKRQDLNRLMATRYGLQAGMRTLVKEKLDTDKVMLIWIRMVKSIEITARRLINTRNPIPDINSDAGGYFKAKKDRDTELQKFMKESSF